MKVQLKEIILAVPALSKLSAGDLQLVYAYRLKKNIAALQKEVDFFAEQRQKIFEKHGDLQEDGTFGFSKENEAEAAEALEELLDLEVSPDAEIMELPVTENLRLSVNDIGLLSPFINFKEA